MKSGHGKMVMAVITVMAAVMACQVEFEDQDGSAAVIGETPSMTEIVPTNTPAPVGIQVEITAGSVNLRNLDGSASGQYLHAGDIVFVEWVGDYGEIVFPGNLAGLKVWRGCTSDADRLGCESK